jgi:UDP-N-acetylmuramoylalanine--D-glutamate ligase
MKRALVFGLGIAGEATARALQRRGIDIVVADDLATPAVLEVGRRLGVDVVTAPDVERLDALVRSVDTVCPAPGITELHPVHAIAASHGVTVRSELDLAYDWEQQRAAGPRPFLAVTGTDGKTTTTLMAVAMLEAAGHRAVAAGNTDVPLVAAIEHDVDVFVVECSSFRLSTTRSFRAEASVWLNLAPDHLNWHADLDSYAAAKAKMWEYVRPDDVAVGNISDPVVMRRLAAVGCRHVTFGPGGDYDVAASGRRAHDGAVLVGPAGPICDVARMRRSLPHDRMNALAAAALVLETGLAAPVDVARALETFAGPRHRIELVAEVGGVAWYDDSKATTPHAASTAIRAFPTVVLVAGGQNKGTDLGVLADVAAHIRSVVAFGEAAEEVANAFDGVRPVVVAHDFTHAVELAASLAVPGDAVLLSPACASFDTHRDYGHRGDDFAALVHALLDRSDTGETSS